MSAAREVFSIAELVELILLNLDAISLVRAQQIDRFGSAVVKASTVLKQRLGLLEAFDEVLNDCRNARWNPLIYSSRIGTPSYLSTPGKTMQTELLGMILMDEFSSSAIQAVQSPSSGLYHISATLPPVKSICLDIPVAHENEWSKKYDTMIIKSPNGVSIGEILAVWGEYATETTPCVPFFVGIINTRA